MLRAVNVLSLFDFTNNIKNAYQLIVQSDSNNGTRVAKTFPDGTSRKIQKQLESHKSKT